MDARESRRRIHAPAEDDEEVDLHDRDVRRREAAVAELRLRYIFFFSRGSRSFRTPESGDTRSRGRNARASSTLDATMIAADAASWNVMAPQDRRLRYLRRRPSREFAAARFRRFRNRSR